MNNRKHFGRILPLMKGNTGQRGDEKGKRIAWMMALFIALFFSGLLKVNPTLADDNIIPADAKNQAYSEVGNTDWRHIQISEANLPDLVVKSFETEVVFPGQQTVDGLITEKTLYFEWTVENKGNGVANPSRLKVTGFEKTGDGSWHKFSLNGGKPLMFDIKQLWPRPGTISGSQKVWCRVPAPDEPIRYSFAAQIDPGKEITEINEYNNALLSSFDTSKSNFKKLSRRMATVSSSGRAAKVRPKARASHVRSARTATTAGGANSALKPTPKILKPSIWFDLHTSPAPSPRLNQPFNLVIGVRNIGSAKNDASHKVVVKLVCTALDRGQCVKLLGDPVVPPIDPGKMTIMNLRSVFKVTKPGRYRISMTLDPAPTSNLNALTLRMRKLHKSWYKDFSVMKLERKQMQKQHRNLKGLHPRRQPAAPGIRPPGPLY